MQSPLNQQPQLPLAAARHLPEGVRAADANPHKDGHKIRVRRYSGVTPGSFSEVEVDLDSFAAREAASGTSREWRAVPPIIKIQNPGGVVHRVHEDHPSVAFAQTQAGKKAGWRLVGDDAVSVIPPEPVVATLWVAHPNGRIVRVTADSHDAQNARASRAGWRVASPTEIARRQELGPNFNHRLNEREM